MNLFSSNQFTVNQLDRSIPRFTPSIFTIIKLQRTKYKPQQLIRITYQSNARVGGKNSKT